MSYFSPNSLSNVSVTNDGTFLGQTGWFNCSLTGSIVGNVTILNNELAVTNSNINLLAGTVSSGNLSVDVRNVVLPVSNIYLSNLSNLDAKQSDVLSNIITTNEYLLTMTNGISGNQYQCNITNTSIVVNNSNIDVIASTVSAGNVKVNVQNASFAVTNSNIDTLASTVSAGNVKVNVQNASFAVTNSNIDTLASTVSAGNVKVNVQNNITGFATSANQTTELVYLQNVSNCVSITGNPTSNPYVIQLSQVAVVSNRTMPLLYGCFKFVQTQAINANAYSTFIDTSNVINNSNSCIYPEGSRGQVTNANVEVSGPLGYIPKGASVTIGLRGMDTGTSTNFVLCPAAVDNPITISNGYVIGDASTVTSAFSNSHCGQWNYPNGVPRYIGIYNSTLSTISNVKVIISFTY